MIRYKAVMVNKDSDFSHMKKTKNKFSGSEVMEWDDLDFPTYEEAWNQARFLNKAQPVVEHNGVAGIWQVYYLKV